MLSGRKKHVITEKMFLPVLLTYDNILTPIPTPCPTSPKTFLHLQLTRLDGAPPTQPGYRSRVAPSQIHALICSHLRFSSAFCGFPLAWSLMSNCSSVFHVPARWITASLVSYSRHSLGTVHHALPLTPQPLLTITPLGSGAHKCWKGHLRALVISAVLGGQTLGLSRSSLEGEGLGGDFR